MLPGAAELGIVDYGRRGTLNVYLNAALRTKGIWSAFAYWRSGFDQSVRGLRFGPSASMPKAACPTR